MRTSTTLLFVFSLLFTFCFQLSQAEAQFYFGGKDQIQVTDVNGLNAIEFLNEEIRGLAIDTTRGILFFSNVSSNFNQVIEKISLDGSGREEILSDSDLQVSDISPEGIALDEGNMKLYIADDLNDGRILAVNYEGSGAQVILAGEADGVTAGISDVAVDTVNNKLYWAKRNAIMRSNMDGTGVEMVTAIDPISGQEDNPVGASVIQVDPAGGKLYWADPFKDQITIADLNGSNKQLLIDTNGSPEGLQLDLSNQTIFWLDDRRFRGEATAFRADLNGENVQEIAVYSTPTSNTGPFVLYKFEIATSVDPVLSDRPDRISLSQNYPNPFNPKTQISFSLSEPGSVRLEVFNSLGQQVALLLSDESYSPGTHIYRFDASGFPSGIYHYRLSANGITLTRSMTLLK